MLQVLVALDGAFPMVRTLFLGTRTLLLGAGEGQREPRQGGQRPDKLGNAGTRLRLFHTSNRRRESANEAPTVTSLGSWANFSRGARGLVGSNKKGV